MTHGRKEMETQETESPPAAGSRGRMTLALCAVAASVLAIVGLTSLQGGSTQGRPGNDVAATSNADPVTAPMAPSAAQPQNAPAATPPPGSATTSTTKVVHIKNYAFSPASLTVSAGTKVTWINDDTAAHTVTTTSGPKSFDSGSIAKGKSFSHTFTAAGTYSYYCAY